MFLRKIAAILISIGLLAAVPVQAQTIQPTIRIDGQQVQLKGPLQSINNRTMIDIEDLAVLVHGKVGKKKNMVTLTVNSTVFGFDPMQKQIYNGTKWIPVDQGAVQVSQTRLMVPLRWILEKLEFTIVYDVQTRIISVKTKQPGEMDVFRQQDLEELSAKDKEFVEQTMKIRGVHKQGDLVVIAWGEAPNPGYGLEFVKQLVSWEQVRVFVSLTKPDPDKMYPQVISYPYLVGKINLAPYTTLRVVDASTNMDLFSSQENESK